MANKVSQAEPSRNYHITG